MLRQRVATGAIAGGLVIAAVFLLPPGAMAALAGAVALAGAWEWSRLAGVRSAPARGAYLALLAVAGGALWLADDPLAAGVVLVAAVAWWGGVAAWLLRGGGPRPVTAGIRWGWLAIGGVLLLSLVIGIALLAGSTAGHRGVLLYAICLVWAADIGAYFIGRTFGRHRLAPAVSAGKTWEGLGGGLAAVLLYALAGAWLLGVSGAALAGWLLLSVLAGLLSVAGDLLESVLKREAGVKDSGRMLPGHGGLLDRIDSLVAAIPVLALGLTALPSPGMP